MAVLNKAKVVKAEEPDYLVDIRRSIMASNEKIVGPILKMLREAHKAIEQEITATGDYEHPAIKRKLEMLERHRRNLEKMGFA